jgi:O-antigen ligase
MTGIRRALAEFPLLVVATLLLSTGADILPGDSLISVGPVELSLARILLLIGFAALVYTHGARRELFATGLGIPLLLLLAAGLIASEKWGTEPRYRFLVECVALLLLAVATIRSRPGARNVLAVVAVVAVTLSALGGVTQVSQGVATGFYRHGCTPVTQAPPLVPSDTITRAIGSFANPNLLAGHLLLLLPLAVAALALLGAARREAALALGLAVALSYLGLVLTFSRTGVLLGILGGAVAVLTSQLPRRRHLAGIAVALAVVGFVLLGTCGSQGAAGFGRIHEWDETMHVIRDHPLFGVGLGRLGEVLHARDRLSTSAHAHNLFLDWWAEAGPLALIAWIWLFAVLAWRSLRAALSGDALGRGALVALLGFGAYSMTDHPANVDRVAIALWVVLAIAATLPRAPIPRPRRRGAHA